MFKNPRISNAQIAVAVIVLALAVGPFIYQLIVHHHVEQSGALLIGLPAILTALFVIAASFWR